MLGIGYYFMRKNKTVEDFYVGGRSLGKWHVGLSVVATDVGGGFSIGLGGLGFMIGLSGSWMLFTGLVGSWIAAVILIPRAYNLSIKHRFTTFPELFKLFYGKDVALIAGFISAIGYLGFTSSQVLAGAKLASSTFVGLDRNTAIIIMGMVMVLYTSFGGLKAVIYTDTIQWIFLILGLSLIGIPICYNYIGGYETISSTLSNDFLRLDNVTWQQLLKWSVTIIPIWFVGMTLYQRIYASKSQSEAKKAWFIAGLFEYPIMAFLGVLLGMFSRVAYDNGMFDNLIANNSSFDAETGIPFLLRNALPVGIMGLVMSAYFSAILSTADSCLIASSGNILTDIMKRWGKFKNEIRVSQFLTLFVGVVALLIAMLMENVLELMLYSYSFMVCGLFVPVVGALFFRITNHKAAFVSMISGGLVTIVLSVLVKTKHLQLPLDLDPNLFGISVAILLYCLVVIIYGRS